MAQLQSRGSWYEAKAQYGCPMLVGLVFSTDGSNDPTLADTVDGLWSIARATNTYTITGPTWGRTGSVTIHCSDNALDCAVTSSPSAGTITLAFSGALTSETVNVVAILSGTTY